jgi:hypothetical protein
MNKNSGDRYFSELMNNTPTMATICNLPIGRRERRERREKKETTDIAKKLLFDRHGLRPKDLSSRYEKQQSMLKLGCQQIIKDEQLLVSVIDDINQCLKFKNLFLTVNISELVKKYHITSYEWFYYLIKRGSPFAMGVLSYDEDKMPKSVEQAKQILELYYYGIDYYYGVPIKQSFTGYIDDINGVGAVLDLQSYDERNKVSLMYQLGKFVASKIVPTC